MKKRNIIIIILIFIIFLFIIKPIYKKEKAKKLVIEQLTEKYGDGNYKIKKIEYKRYCEYCDFSMTSTSYELIVETNYIEDTIKVTASPHTYEINHDDLLDKYYKEKYNVDDIDEYIIKARIDEFNQEISKKFNSSISFEDTYINSYRMNKYNHIPSVEELKKEITLNNPRIDIDENLKTEKELLNYLIKFTKFYIKDLNKDNIDYSYESKYFRYKYDYKKLGIYNYHDQYNGYGGYVYAGDYIRDGEGYKSIKEDEIIRINIMGKVTTLKTEDVLK